MRDYKGIVIEESLENIRLINQLEVIKVEISKEEPVWHMYTVNVSMKDIEKLSRAIKQGWYMHFWKGRIVIAIFKNKKFEFDYDNKSTWKNVINYGLSLGIPKEQLDFPID
jgi:hypothetical protein